VIKSLSERYKPGKRAWRKFRSRSTTEAVAGAVIGPLARPTRLVLGLPDTHGKLRITGTTSALPASLHDELSAHLTPAQAGHPWPEHISARLAGAWDSDQQRIPLTRVQPTLVVEIDVDASTDDSGRHRHQVRFVRIRPDLRPEDLPQIPK